MPEKDGPGRPPSMNGVQCPSCGWVPPRSATWRCVCGHEWNTFETGGQCPRCRKAWDATVCFNCEQFLAHDAWYVDQSRPEAAVRRRRRKRVVSRRDRPHCGRSVPRIRGFEADIRPARPFAKPDSFAGSSEIFVPNPDTSAAPRCAPRPRCRRRQHRRACVAT